MRAAVYHGPKQIAVQDMPKPSAGPDEVVLKIHDVGICGTDLHIYNGGTAVKPGTVIGHEFSGEIVEVGPGVLKFRVGDRVVAEHVVTCRTCYYCTRGQPELCLNASVLGMDRPGALAEYMVVPASLVHPIPDTLSFEDAALIEPLSIAVFAAARARSLIKQRVAIVGQGPIGMLLDQVVKAAGARVIGIDAQVSRLDFVRQRGWVEQGLNPTEPDFQKKLDEISTIGVDSSFEVVGKEVTAGLCIEITRRGGDVFLLGVFEQPAKLDLMKVVKKELNISGSWTCAFSFPAAINLVAKKKIQLHEMITHRYGLEDIATAFREASEYRDSRIKTVIHIARP